MDTSVDSTKVQQHGDVSGETTWSMKNYTLYYTTSRMNARLQTGSNDAPAQYYLQSSIMGRRCRLFLRRGNDKTSPMVAFAEIRNFSRHMRIGKGDYNKAKEDETVWTELFREKNQLKCSDYHFGTTEGSETGKKEEFRWRKDREKIGSTVYDGLSENGDIVARLLSGGALNWKKGGELKVLEGLDQGQEEMLLISALAIWAMEAFLYQSLLKGY